MKRLVFYGDDLVAIDIPDDTRVIRAPEPVPGLPDYEESVREAVRSPLGTKPLGELAGPGSTVTIAFDDPCLPLPPMKRDLRGRAVGVVLEELLRAGVEKNRITLICANGLHRKWRPQELRFVLGRRVWSEMGPSRVLCHDAEDPLAIVELGESAGGHPVNVNSAVTSSDLLVYVNINWTTMNGGWKSTLVGLGDYRSISSHHNMAVLAEGGSVMEHTSLFHRILREMGEVVASNARVFTIETVINNRVWGPLVERFLSLERGRRPVAFAAASPLPGRLKGTASSRLRSGYQPVAVNAGEVDQVHEKTLNALYGQQTVTVEGQTDALILGLPNISPYSVFSRINPLLAMNTALGYVFNMHRGKPVVREGGALILVQPFQPGFDRRHHPSYIDFYQEVLTETLDPYRMESLFEEKYARDPDYIEKYRFANAYHGVHPFYVWGWAAASLKYLDRVIVVGAVDPSVTERMGLQNARSVEEALKTAEESLGRGYSLTHLVVPPVFLTEVI